MHIPKAQIEKKIKEIAVKERRQGYYKVRDIICTTILYT